MWGMIRCLQCSVAHGAAMLTERRLAGAQVLAHEWVATRGGVVPRLLQPTVVRGAANVASVRRLRNLVHGVVALNRVVAPDDSEPGLGGALAGGGAPGSPGGSLHRRGESSPMDRCDSAPLFFPLDNCCMFCDQ